MKKMFIALCIAIALLPAAYANGQSESETSIDGDAVLTENEDGTKSLEIQTRDRDRVRVMISDADMARLQIRNNEQIQARGVFLGETTENRVQSRVFARTMTIAGKTTKMTDPVQLTKQERAQLRTYEAEQTQTKSQTRTGSGG